MRGPGASSILAYRSSLAPSLESFRVCFLGKLFLRYSSWTSSDNWPIRTLFSETVCDPCMETVCPGRQMRSDTPSKKPLPHPEHTRQLLKNWKITEWRWISDSFKWVILVIHCFAIYFHRPVASPSNYVPLWLARGFRVLFLVARVCYRQGVLLQWAKQNSFQPRT